MEQRRLFPLFALIVVYFQRSAGQKRSSAPSNLPCLWIWLLCAHHMPRQYEETSGALRRPGKINVLVIFCEADGIQKQQQLFEPQTKSTGHQALKNPSTFPQGMFSPGCGTSCAH